MRVGVARAQSTVSVVTPAGRVVTHHRTGVVIPDRDLLGAGEHRGGAGLDLGRHRLVGVVDLLKQAVAVAAAAAGGAPAPDRAVGLDRTAGGAAPAPAPGAADVDHAGQVSAGGLDLGRVVAGGGAADRPVAQLARGVAVGAAAEAPDRAV